MTKILPLALLVFAFCFNQVNAQKKDVKEETIDSRCDKCLDTATTTAGMVQCETKAYAEWDKVMNDYYKMLMKELTPPAKEKLRASQRQWIAYRDSEFAFQSRLYSDMQGTMYRQINAADNVEVVRSRALELKAYYEILHEDEGENEDEKD